MGDEMKKSFLVLMFVLIGLIVTLSSCIHEHEWSEWKTIKAATCTTEGSAERTCECGEKESKKLIALAHSEMIEAIVAPTCTESGRLTEGKYCLRCGEVFAKAEIVAALGHDYVNHEAKEPTCTEIGWEAYVDCSRCSYTTYVEKPAILMEVMKGDNAKTPIWDTYKEIISKYDNDMQETIYVFPHEINMPYGELNSACKNLRKQDLIKIIIYSSDQYNPIGVHLTHKGLHFDEEKRRSWIRFWVPVIISILALLIAFASLTVDVIHLRQGNSHPNPQQQSNQ